MKGGIFSLLFLLIAGIMVAQAFTPPPVHKPQKPNQPWYPGTPPFNPKFPSGPWGRPRYVRAADKNKNHGQIDIHAQKEGGKTSWDANVQQNIWSNDKGSVWVSGGASKRPGQHTQGQVGIGGSIKW